ncbi:MAG: UDP-N-acetylmuramate dehydrogenase [Candidatus Kapabacteria bacterium]|nr:UDP-N-acetylmuramate dehydrogenase [Candidatus Kapabacteria bacterium]
MQHSLRTYNTFGFDAYANRVSILRTVDDVHSLVESGAMSAGNDVLVIGGGSNILLTRNVEHVALMQIRGIDILFESEHDVTVRFGAGENWHSCTEWAVAHGYGGIENLALIPGTVGAAPIQNIGAYGVELVDSFLSLQYIHTETNDSVMVNKGICEFGYRDSIFKHALKGSAIITAVTLTLSKQPSVNADYKDVRIELERQDIASPTIADIHRAVVAIRQAKLPDPAKIGNAGSFFKNPVVAKAVYERIKQEYNENQSGLSVPHYVVDSDSVKIPAAWLIEQCGFKGIRRGAVGVHERQALVLVHTGGGTGADIYRLAEEIQSTVEDRFGIHLTMEVNII